MRVKRPVYDSSANQARTFARRTQSPRPYQVPGYMRTAAIGLPCALYVRISSAARYVDVYTCAQDMYVRVRSVVLPRQVVGSHNSMVDGRSNNAHLFFLALCLCSTAAVSMGFHHTFLDLLTCCFSASRFTFHMLLDIDGCPVCLKPQEAGRQCGSCCCLNRSFYPPTSAVPRVPFLILHPREIQILWSQTVETEKNQTRKRVKQKNEIINV